MRVGICSEFPRRLWYENPQRKLCLTAWEFTVVPKRAENTSLTYHCLVGHTVENVLHTTQEEGVTYKVWEIQVPVSKGKSLQTQGQLCRLTTVLHLRFHNGHRAVHYSDMQWHIWSKINVLSASYMSQCLFHLNFLFVSWRHLNLSTFLGGSHSKSLLRVFTSDKLSWIG